MGKMVLKARLALAVLGLVLVVCLAEDPEPSAGNGPSEDDSVLEADGLDEEEPVLNNVNSTLSPCVCENGKCEHTDEGIEVCVCNPGYLGEKCDQMADEWDVYWSHAMRKSEMKNVKPKA